MAPMSSEPPSQEDEVFFSPGDLCETLTVLTLRSEESVLSDIVTELPQGLGVQVVTLGSSTPRLRAHVRAGRLEGWITARTSGKRPHIRRRPPEQPASGTSDLVEGAHYQVVSFAPVRAGESVDSPLLGELPGGALVRLLEMGRGALRNRARVEGDNLEGWITSVTYVGQPLLVRSTKPRSTARASFSTDPPVKELLERAKAGDALGLRKLLEGSDTAEAPNVNSSDVRGRTLLMYAAHAGSCETVQYILSRHDVCVNELDDTQRSALHYVARLPAGDKPQAKEPQRAELVKLLVAAGVSVDSRDHCGCTPLMLAAAAGDVGVIGALVEAGAKVDAKDYEERPVLSYATSLGREEASKCLLEAGAEDLEDELAAPPRVSFAVSGRRRSFGLRQSVLMRRQSSAKGRASMMSARRSTLLSAVCMLNASRRGTRQSVLWTTGLAAGGDVGVEVFAIEEAVETPQISEEEAAKERALAKLRAIMAEGEAAAPVELERVLAEAEAAEVEGAILQEAQGRVEFLRSRALAHDVLLAAIADRSAPALRDAIAKAEEKQVPAVEVDRAKAVLAEEEPKEKAWQRLGVAQDKGDTTSLRGALDEAKKAGITADDLEPFEDLLRGAESKEQAEAALQEAIEEREVVALRFALEQAGAAGASAELIAKGEETLKAEEPLHEARKAMEELQDGVSIEEMKALLARVKEVGLQEEEYAALEEMLTREEEKERALAEVNSALEEVKDVSLQSLPDVTAARDRLAAAVTSAMDAGAAEADVKAANTRRRKLHNAIQDLKGAIRVFCRIRPLNSREKNLNDEIVVHANEDGLSLRVEDAGGHADFSFDAVFAPGTQEEVFEEAKDLVQSALDGYNVTIFAYGQTGAGKTFTMYGVPGMQGTAPRTIHELYRLIDEGRDRFAYTVLGSMMELYRNDLVDLLVRKTRASTVAKAAAQKRLSVHMSKAGSVVIDHLTEEECASAEELSELLERGNSQRTVAATAMNSESSRSHLLLVIQIICVNRETGEQVRGKILMCDLAGSERLKKSEVTGDMQKEAIEINKSLTALGDVIECLTKGKGHVPYRNHTLTQVMQDALGGTSKTLMFLNCSPASNNADETLMAIKYATRAKKISNDPNRKSQKV